MVLAGTVSDGNVTIRPTTAADVPTLLAGRDDESRRFVGDADPEPHPVACIVVDEAVVGWVDHDRDRHWLGPDEVNVGYCVFPEHRGRGHATRALKLLLRHLDQDTEWRVATLLIHPDNEPSLALARRAGFEEVGELDGNPYWKRDVRQPGAARIRPAGADDAAFLEQMLAAAADWRPGVTPRPVAEVLAEPSLAHYVLGWPRPGDVGVIAEDDAGEPLGAAWCRAFPPEDSGFGFVAAEVPEVSIGVVAAARGQGIGRRLLQALADEARRRGVGKLSLSVEVDNHARWLYADLGFVVVAEADGAVTMLLDLGRTRA
jgi:RimJ/RimL family protein N-acetyltransferase